jgi:hypothetical protein
LAAVATGAGLTIAVVMTLFWHPVLLITVRVYAPVMVVVARRDTTGLWSVEVNPEGPVQEKDVIPAGPPVSVKGVPAHTGPLFAAAGTGKAFTTAVVDSVLRHPLLLITVRV